MNQPKDQLSEALLRLNALAPEGAPPALGDQLRDEFRRHYEQQRRNRYVRISLLAACLIGAVALSVIALRPRTTTKVVVTRPEVAATVLPSEPIPALVDQLGGHPVESRVHKAPSPVSVARKSQAYADQFVALPTFDPAIPIDHLDMVRLDLPGRALQLVGYPVSEDMAERRILADVLLAQDGTPYALRLVQTSQNEGR